MPFRQLVGANLAAGQFDLVIVVDSITDELEKVVRYLNEHTVAEIRVLALELGYVADGDYQMLVPHLYGVESATRKAQPSTTHVWDEESLFNALEQRCSEGVPLIRRLYDLAVERDGGFSWGGSASPSVTASLTVGTVRTMVWRCWTGPLARWVVIFDGMQKRGVTPERMQRLLEQLRTIPGVAEHLEGVEEAGWRKRGRIPISLLAAPGATDTVVRAVEELLDA